MFSKIKKAILKPIYKEEKIKSVKKVIIFSTLSGIISSMATKFFSKQENVDELNKNAKIIGNKVKEISKEISDKTVSEASKIGDQIKSTSNDFKNNVVSKIQDLKTEVKSETQKTERDVLVKANEVVENKIEELPKK